MDVKEEAEAKKRLEEERKENESRIKRGFEDVFDARTQGWVGLAGTYLVKRDGGGMNIHFRTNTPYGEGHFFVPAKDFGLLSMVFSHAAREYEKFARDSNKTENSAKS